jgi:hypothetical protein
MMESVAEENLSTYIRQKLGFSRGQHTGYPERLPSFYADEFRDSTSTTHDLLFSNFFQVLYINHYNIPIYKVWDFEIIKKTLSVIELTL